MNIELVKKLDELIEIIDNSDEMKRLLVLKEEIYQDDILMQKLDEIKKQDNTYGEEYLTLKKDILSNELIKEYKVLEDNFFLLTLGISNKLKHLTGEKGGCHADN